MNLGDFIMKNIDWITLSSIIAGVLAIIKVLKDNKTLKEQNEEIKIQFRSFSNQTKALILETKDSFKDEYKNLSKEHNNLNKEHNNLSKEHILLINNTKDTKNIVGKINDMLIEEKAKIHNLSKSELDINKTVEHISSLMEILKIQNEKIINLEKQKSDLEKENIILKETVNNYNNKNRFNDWDLEL